MSGQATAGDLEGGGHMSWAAGLGVRPQGGTLAAQGCTLAATELLQGKNRALDAEDVFIFIPE